MTAKATSGIVLFVAVGSSARSGTSLPSENERPARDLFRFMFAQRLADAFGVPQCALDVPVDRTVFEEHDGFATDALPGIAALHASRLVAKDRLAAVAAELNGIVHLVFSSIRAPFFWSSRKRFARARS